MFLQMSLLLFRQIELLISKCNNLIGSSSFRDFQLLRNRSYCVIRAGSWDFQSDYFLMGFLFVLSALQKLHQWMISKHIYIYIYLNPQINGWSSSVFSFQVFEIDQILVRSQPASVTMAMCGWRCPLITTESLQAESVFWMEDKSCTLQRKTMPVE